MNVWIKKARKKATCTYEGCGDTAINNGEFYIVYQWKMRNWTKQRVMHIGCWIEQGIAEINSRPKAETRGGHMLSMADEDKQKRFTIMRRRASIVQRIKAAVDVGRYDMVENLHCQLEQCKIDIEQYGGVPKKW